MVWVAELCSYLLKRCLPYRQYNGTRWHSACGAPELRRKTLDKSNSDHSFPEIITWSLNIIQMAELFFFLQNNTTHINAQKEACIFSWRRFLTRLTATNISKTLWGGEGGSVGFWTLSFKWGNCWTMMSSRNPSQSNVFIREWMFVLANERAWSSHMVG